MKRMNRRMADELATISNVKMTLPHQLADLVSDGFIEFEDCFRVKKEGGFYA